MRGGHRDGAGRKPVEIDFNELEKLCFLHCTDEELAAWFGCSVRTIEKRRKNPTFRQVMEHGKAKGRVSLRRIQVRLAEESAPMAIWLGKQLLNQRDVSPVEVSGPAGGPLKLDLETIDAILKHKKKDG